MLVEINKGSNYVAAQKINLAIDVELDGRFAKYDAQAKKLAMQPMQKRRSKVAAYCGQLDQERQRLLAASRRPPPPLMPLPAVLLNKII